MPVNVSGVKQLQKAMREVEPELNKQMSKDIKTAMLIVRDKARGYLPQQNEVLSGWGKGTASADTIKYRAFPAYDYSLAKSLIKYNAGTNSRNRSGYRAAFYVANISAPGAIFETAGRANANKLGNQLGFVGAGRTRFIGPAVYKARRGIENEMKDMILDTARTVKKAM